MIGTLVRKKARWLLVDFRRRLFGLPHYEWHYTRSYFKYFVARCGRNLLKPRVDLVLVLPDLSKGWILDGVCRELACAFPGKWEIASDVNNLPSGKSYYFAHYSFLPEALKANLHIWGAKRVALFTHPKEPDFGGPEMIYALNCATTVVSMCSLFAKQLVDLGVAANRVKTITMGTDPVLFPPHERGTGDVGFCSAYYPRKDPDRILNLVQAMPHRRFRLLGRNWHQYERFGELRALPNFEYLEAPYEKYPKFYTGIDVFVSPARLEGGPIPLLEAMMSNCVPIASRTGFAPDIIRHGDNGFLFNVDAEIGEIRNLIEKAFTVNTNIRETVQHLTRQRFAREIQRYF